MTQRAGVKIVKKANSRYFTGCLAVEVLEKKKKTDCSKASYLEAFAQTQETVLCLVNQNLSFDPTKNGFEIVILFFLAPSSQGLTGKSTVFTK